MRKNFADLLHHEMESNEDIIVLTADLGYGLWDKIRDDYPDRFYNVGSSEHLMMSMACGLAMDGKVPVAYSITPFLLYRPFEVIRNYVDHERIPVKLVGGGRDQDYGYLGFSHWAEDDKKIMSCFKNIGVFHPESLEELETMFEFFIDSKVPQYLNLRRK